MVDEPGAKTAFQKAEFVSLHQSLSVRLDGMATFITTNRLDWRHSSATHPLRTQGLRHLTLRLKRETGRLADGFAPSNATRNHAKEEQ